MKCMSCIRFWQYINNFNLILPIIIIFLIINYSNIKTEKCFIKIAIDYSTAVCVRLFNVGIPKIDENGFGSSSI